MNKLIFLFSLCLLICAGSCSSALGDVDLESPNGEIKLRFSIVNGVPVYRVSYSNKVLLKDSELGFTLSNGSRIQDGFEIADTNISSANQTWRPVYGERSQIRDYYNEAVVNLRSQRTPVNNWQITFRCYNEGVAFCSKLMGEKNDAELQI